MGTKYSSGRHTPLAWCLFAVTACACDGMLCSAIGMSGQAQIKDEWQVSYIKVVGRDGIEGYLCTSLGPSG